MHTLAGLLVVHQSEKAPRIIQKSLLKRKITDFKYFLWTKTFIKLFEGTDNFFLITAACDFSTLFLSKT
ncbi:hypothetical protein EGR_07440 [Echinococcus granulosus]|uniref:Uncharacterized protein n=1 Tax=Echinococcus granulosus TaxID=6210 RepID=W6UW46_ECHGR|nr:hypothetical protein EGR_07440 [Echinococcus granulosus]EUB57699.1 hypothetical protein EGR_07440 [Echinococcus granulosus]